METRSKTRSSSSTATTATPSPSTRTRKRPGPPSPSSHRGSPSSASSSTATACRHRFFFSSVQEAENEALNYENSIPCPAKMPRYRFYFSSLRQAEAIAPMPILEAVTEEPGHVQEPGEADETGANVNPGLDALQQQAAPAPVAAERVCPEIWMVIGEYLEDRDLGRSMQVSRSLRENLTPLAWRSITHEKWACPQFQGLRGFLAGEEDDELAALLRRVVEVEWADDDNSGLTCKELVGLLRMLPNLQGLRLRATAPAKKVLLDLLKDMNALPKLVRLALEVPGFIKEEEAPELEEGELEEEAEEGEMMELQMDEPVQPRDLWNRIGRMEELDLGGAWYAPQASVELADQQQTQLLLNLVSLRTPRTDLGLLMHSPNLKKLALTGDPDVEDETRLSPILVCERLEELAFRGRMAFRISDMVQVCRGLTTLTLVSVTLNDVDEFERLDAMRSREFAPHLEAFVVEVQSEVNELEQILHWRHTIMLTDLVCSHTDLRTLILRGFFILPHEFFPGFEETQTPIHQFPTRQLESLWVEIDISPFMGDNDELRQEVWNNVYKELGRMNDLHSLTINSQYLDISFQAGFGRLDQITRLQHLGLSDSSAQDWEYEDLFRVMLVAPHLTSLHIDPLDEVNYEQVQDWL
ncbi:hypothetical protein BGW39_002544, partial [Mortierella sp. 14UC]